METLPPQECPRCGNQLAEDATGNGVCPQCALRASRPSSFWESSSGNLAQKYVKNVRRILTEPAAFFREMPVTGGMGGPLAFALITHWLGKFASYLWGLVFGQAIFPAVLKYLDRLQEISGDEASGIGGFPFLRDRMAEWSSPHHWVHSLFGAASLALNPFFTIVALFYSAALLWIGARLFIVPGKDGAPTEITFESILRVACYASTPVILSFIPMIGGFLATVGGFVVLVIGLRETYRSTSGRAIVVAIFPELLLFALALLAMSAFFALFVGIFARMAGA